MPPLFLASDDPRFPALLREVRPPVRHLWVLGRTLHDLAPCVAIVGPRNPTPYGIEVTRDLAYGLARAGVCIVSGMARGIDAVAHEAALAAGAPTIAVLGTGVDVPFPASNRDLYERITQHGVVVSEQPLGAPGFKSHFPARNRIIAGLSLGVVVVQAGQRSGALSTASHARENNRDVLAVPGDIRSPLSVGVHALLRDGAGVCTGVEDVLLALRAELARAARGAPA